MREMLRSVSDMQHCLPRAQLFKLMTISSRLISTKALLGVLTVVLG